MNKKKTQATAGNSKKGGGGRDRLYLDMNTLEVVPAAKGGHPKTPEAHPAATAKADRGNARFRGERAQAPDGMTAGRRSAAADERATAESKKPAAPKPAKKAAQASGKLSSIAAAAMVLAESDKPLSCKELVEAMAAKGYWSSAKGKTPAATLYSAILRDIQKGGEARFKKTDRGLFTLNGK